MSSTSLWGPLTPCWATDPRSLHAYLRSNDAAHTGMVMLQLETPDGTVLDRLVKHYDLTVLDVLARRGLAGPPPAERPVVGCRTGRRGRGALGRATSTRLAGGAVLLTQPALLRPGHRPHAGFGCWRVRRSRHGHRSLRWPSKPRAMHGCATQQLEPSSAWRTWSVIWPTMVEFCGRNRPRSGVSTMHGLVDCGRSGCDQQRHLYP